MLLLFQGVELTRAPRRRTVETAPPDEREEEEEILAILCLMAAAGIRVSGRELTTPPSLNVQPATLSR
jgi:hypothetical protein